jgi:hypothetical protein
MQMMVNDGSLGVKQPMPVLLDQDFGINRMHISKNWLGLCPTSETKSYQPSTTTPINLLLIHSIIS